MGRKIEDWIIFEDEHLVAVNKPSNMPSIPERNPDGSIKSIYELAIDKGYLICHRLDKETSGIMILAKNPNSHREINLLFQNKEVKKFYHAIVHNPSFFDNLLVELPLLITKRKVFANKSEGKKAETILNTLENYKHFSLVECQPKTGRQHQIRVHLSTQNQPIVGDELYGGHKPKLNDFKRKFTGDSANELIHRFALHARRTEFTLMGKDYSIEAEYPNDFATLLKIIKKWDA
jgi:23S rRNA pseudouridine955/2504/2580 synthase